MGRRTVENCRVIKIALYHGHGIPYTVKLGNKVFCQGYQKSECDDEPYHKCRDCKLNIFYEE